MPLQDVGSRSEEVDDLLGSVPSWLLRAGNSLLCLVFAILVLLGALVQYPDVVSARIDITSLDPPARLVAQSSGRLDKLLVAEGQVVTAGTWLGILENAADAADVQRVLMALPALERRLADPAALVQLLPELPAQGKLGSPHFAYSALLRGMQTYQLFRAEQYHEKKIAMLAAQVLRQQQIVAKSRTQLEIVQRELTLATSHFDRERALLVRGVSAPAEVEGAELALQQKQRLAADLQANLFDQELRIQDYEKAQLDLRREREERHQELLLTIQESYKRLASELTEWEQRYVIKSPLQGRVVLHKVWADHQHVVAGTEVMAVLSDRKRMIGRIELRQLSSGKVQVGQRVNIRLDGYPFHEFGMVRGTVESIAPISQGGAYDVRVSFPGGELRSSSGRHLEFKDGMQGSCDIVTADLSVIERILDKVLYSMSQP